MSKKIYGRPVTTPMNPKKIVPDDIVKTVNGIAPDRNGNVEIERGTATDEQIASAVESYLEENPVECEGVKTVNGKTPDENGNVEVTGISSVSWSDIEDKPFYEKRITLLDEEEFYIDDLSVGYAEVGSDFLEVGKTYKVIFNGNSYTGVCFFEQDDDVEGSACRKVVSKEYGFGIVQKTNSTEIEVYSLRLPEGNYPLTVVKVTEMLDSDCISTSWENIQDKPFYDKTVVLYENLTVVVDEEGYAKHYIDTNFLLVGETYVVEVDGKSYSLVCELIDDVEFTGNLYYNLEGDNFEVYTAEPEQFLEFDGKAYSNQTISLKISKPNIKKLDSKYVDLSGYAKTVNGITPDENGNVEVAVSGGLNTTVANLLIEILESAVYSANVSGKIASLKEALASGGSSGGDTGGDSGDTGGDSGDTGGDEPDTSDTPDEPIADDITVSNGIMTIVTVGSEITVSGGVMTIA